jgi:hypothetical protein
MHTTDSSSSFPFYLPDFNTEGCNKDEGVELEHDQKEVAELVKHFNEKVPKHANIWSKVRQAKTVIKLI